MYIQDKVEEYADEVFDLLDKGVSFLNRPDILVWIGTVYFPEALHCMREESCIVAS